MPGCSRQTFEQAVRRGFDREIQRARTVVEKRDTERRDLRIRVGSYDPERVSGALALVVDEHGEDLPVIGLVHGHAAPFEIPVRALVANWRREGSRLSERLDEGVEPRADVGRALRIGGPVRLRRFGRRIRRKIGCKARRVEEAREDSLS